MRRGSLRNTHRHMTGRKLLSRQHYIYRTVMLTFSGAACGKFPVSRWNSFPPSHGCIFTGRQCRLSASRCSDPLSPGFPEPLHALIYLCGGKFRRRASTDFCQVDSFTQSDILGRLFSKYSLGWGGSGPQPFYTKYHLNNYLALIIAPS